jgi:hypothetical protein
MVVAAPENCAFFSRAYPVITISSKRLFSWVSDALITLPWPIDMVEAL